jgi:HAD superfamily hydrolase (TIGR01490 family)
MGFFLKGLSAEEVEKMYLWMASDYFMSRAKPETVRILKEHIEKEHIVAIVSGSYRSFLKLIGRELGVDHVLGTEVELKDGVHTGRIIKPLCFGKYKAEAISNFIEHEKLDIDLDNSYAYVDNISDLPMLEMVGNPAAAYPDKELLKLARQRDWRVVG